MTKQEAKDYVNKRWNELTGTSISDRVNIILQELKQYGAHVYIADEWPVPIKAISIERDGGIRYHV